MNNPKKQPRRGHPQSTVNTRAGTRHRDPLIYRHPYDSMRRYAELLSLRHGSPRTRYSYTTGGWEASGETARKCSPEPAQGETTEQREIDCRRQRGGLSESKSTGRERVN